MGTRRLPSVIPSAARNPALILHRVKIAAQDQIPRRARNDTTEVGSQLCYVKKGRIASRANEMKGWG